MRPPTLRRLALLLVLWSLPACDSGAASPGGGGAGVAADVAAEEAFLTGPTDRQELEADQPDWVAAEVEAEPDVEAARALLDVAPGAAVTVFLGTWCSDSERELARLWRGLDEAGVVVEEELPFTLEYVALDRDREEPGGRGEGLDIRFVPTFVVRRDGREVGRVVEASPGGIERDLLALLSGEASGVLSTRTDLGTGDGPPS